MKFVRYALLAAILLAGFAGEAYALAFKDIAGKWCGLTTNYTFSRNTLVVTFHNGSPTKRFTVTSYDYSDDTVKMHWEDKGEKVFTDFSEFTDDGTTAQQKNASGPRRPYHRC